MYFSKCISQNVFLNMYFSKCDTILIQCALTSSPFTAAPTAPACQRQCIVRESTDCGVLDCGALECKFYIHPTPLTLNAPWKRNTQWACWQCYGYGRTDGKVGGICLIIKPTTIFPIQHSPFACQSSAAELISKGWPPSAKLKPTFTFLGRDFAIFNTFSWKNSYQEKWKLVLALHWVAR